MKSRNKITTFESNFKFLNRNTSYFWCSKKNFEWIIKFLKFDKITYIRAWCTCFYYIVNFITDLDKGGQFLPKSNISSINNIIQKHF